MNTTELLEKIKELIAKGDINAAKEFINENKDSLGDYLEQAKGLLDGLDLSKGLDGVLDKAKDLGLDTDKGAGLIDKVKGLFSK
ncbi:hypothetical protein ACVRZR_08745 [Streptococcus entericus]|uniref:hypothetical protein n=1 Tax=Streptococcus entericus TaxID=155680 RepID=UPI000376C60A|nr:hypothetical protein [Streptococcus entericus]